MEKEKSTKREAILTTKRKFATFLQVGLKGIMAWNEQNEQ
jgi:hypothetical protein